MSAALYDNTTIHVRFVPSERRFSYRIFQLFLDIDRVDTDARGLKLLSHNRFNLFSFYDRDHGDRTGAPLRAWAETAFTRAGVDLQGGAVRLLTFPRILGYVFNPLSVFFGYGPAGDVRGVIYEVNNTFGESHAYVAKIGAEAPGRHTAEKRLHVSPFFDVRGEYRFTIAPPQERFSLAIENHVDGRREHLATLVGRRTALTDSALLRAFLALPLMTAQVIAAIHWQAIRTWAKGARYRRKPPAPHRPLSVAKPENELNIA